MTYRQIASAMGVSETTVSSMRRSGTEPRATEAVKIANRLGTTIEYLVGIPSEPDLIDYKQKYLRLRDALKELIGT